MPIVLPFQNLGPLCNQEGFKGTLLWKQNFLLVGNSRESLHLDKNRNLREFSCLLKLLEKKFLKPMYQYVFL